MTAKPSTGNPCGGSGVLPKGVVGLVHHFEWALTFAAWAASLRYPPTVEQIAARFGVSRATSYRYKAAWEAVVGAGLAPPPRSLRAEHPHHRSLR